MSADHRVRRLLSIGLVLAALLPLPSAAPAAGLIDFFLGTVKPAAPPSPPLSSYDNPDPASANSPLDQPRVTFRVPEASGGSVAYCVRTCDGQHFPVPHNANVSETQACSSLCPATQTKVFRGGSIDNAVASDGAHYRDLPNAFLYREHFVAACTCNGRSPAGLARVDVKSDPTLHAGDIVATTEGLMSYRGRGGRAETAQFTPIDPVRVSSDMRRMLSATRVYAIKGDDPLTASASTAPAAPVADKNRARHAVR